MTARLDSVPKSTPTQYLLSVTTRSRSLSVRDLAPSGTGCAMCRDGARRGRSGQGQPSRIHTLMVERPRLFQAKYGPARSVTSTLPGG